MGAVQKMGEDGKVPFKEFCDPYTVVKIDHYMALVQFCDILSTELQRWQALGKFGIFGNIWQQF